MSASDLLRQGQHLLAQSFPAEIKLGHQTYRAATNGLHRGERLGEGPGEILRRIAFWLPVLSFIQAGQPIPRPLSAIYHDGIEYQIDTVFIDPTKTNITLNCIQHPL